MPKCIFFCVGVLVDLGRWSNRSRRARGVSSSLTADTLAASFSVRAEATTTLTCGSSSSDEGMTHGPLACGSGVARLADTYAHGTPWDPMGPHGLPCAPYGVPWVPMGLGAMGPRGTAWVSKAPAGSHGVPMPHPGSPWDSM